MHSVRNKRTYFQIEQLKGVYLNQPYRSRPSNSKTTSQKVKQQDKNVLGMSKKVSPYIFMFIYVLAFT